MNEEVEICAGIGENGQPCGERVHRMPPAQDPYCYRRGCNVPGDLYVPKNHADRLTAELATIRAVTGYAVNAEPAACHHCGSDVPAFGGIRSNAAVYCVACERALARTATRGEE